MNLDVIFALYGTHVSLPSMVRGEGLSEGRVGCNPSVFNPHLTTQLKMMTPGTMREEGRLPGVEGFSRGGGRGQVKEKGHRWIN